MPGSTFVGALLERLGTREYSARGIVLRSGAPASRVRGTHRRPVPHTPRMNESLPPPGTPANGFTAASLLLFAASVALVAGAFAYAAHTRGVASRSAWIGMNYLTSDSLTARRGGGAFTFGKKFVPGTILQVEPSSPAEAAGLRAGDRVLSIAGVPARAESALAVLATRTRAGDSLSYRIARGADTLTIAVAPISGASHNQRSFPWFYLAVALATWLIGLFVSIRRPGDRRAVLFGLTCATAAATYILTPLIKNPAQANGIQPAGNVPLELGIMIAAIAITAMLFSALLLHFALVFPHRRPAVRTHPEWLHWIYAALLYPPLGLGVAIGGALLAGRAPALATAGVAMMWLLGVFAFSRRRMAMPGFRERVLRQPWFSIILMAGFGAIGAMVAGDLKGPGLRMVRIAGMTTAMLVPLAGFLLLPFGFGIATIVALVRSYRESGIEDRQQIRWPLWGIVLSVSLSLVLTVVSIGLALALDTQVMHRVQSWLTALTGLLTLIIPVTFAVGILKYRLMDLDVVIRRASIYGVSLGVLTLVFVALVAGLGGLIGQMLGLASHVVTSGATVAVALIAVPAFRRVQGVLDQRFFRTRYDAAAVLRRIGDATAQVSDSATLGRRAIEELRGALRCRTAALLVRRGSALVPAAAIGFDSERLERVPAEAAFAGALAGATHVRVLGLTGPLADAARRARADVLVPARHRGEIHGVLALGAKLSDEDFTLGDLEFLTAAAGQIAAGLASSKASGQNRELNEAREIQASLLPSRLPAFEGFDLAAHWQPAQQVAGDYYDAFVIETRGLALCVADVTGKGMPAALLMSNLQATVKAFAPIASGPAALVERLNRALSTQLTPGRFVTLFYAEVDSRSRVMSYVNAGHNHPLLLRADGSAEWLDRGGPLLGPVHDAVFETGVVTLAPGDRVVLYTDGITEAEGANRELFGEERLLEAVRSAAFGDAVAIQRALLTAVSAHCGGEFQDDATVLVIAGN